MDHPPFTLAYMQEGEMPSVEINADDRRSESIEQQEPTSNGSRIRSRQRICENKSVSEGCGETDPGGEEDPGAMEEIKVEMNITINENERISFFRILRMAMKHRMKILAQEVSITGLSYLVKPSSHKVGSILRKLMWTMLLLFGTGFMVFQVSDRILYYLAYPTIVNYRVAYNRSLRFPTVTVCPEFLISKKAFSSFAPETSRLAPLRFPPFWDPEFRDDYRSLNFLDLDFDWDFFYNSVLVKPEEMLLECSFGKQPCNSRNEIEQIFTDQGFCLSFNPVTSNYVTTQPGANNGLRLVFWVNQSDCYLTLSPAVGFKDVLHDPNDQPVVQDAGFRVGTGVSTSVPFSLRNVTKLSMLPAPYGDCNQAENYTYMKCITNCFQKFMMSYCKCRPPRSQVPGKICSFGQYYYCVSRGIKEQISTGVWDKWPCPLQCHQPTYPFSVTTSPLSEHFLNYMSQKTQFKGRNLTMSRLSKELVYLDIFYSDLNYIDIQTTPAYDFLTLVCDIGSAMGLILGGTLLTFFEFLQVLIELSHEFVTSARFARMQPR